VPAATTESVAVAPADAARATVATAGDAFAEIAMPARDLVEAAETAIAGAAFGRPHAAAATTTDYLVLTSTDPAQVTNRAAEESTDGVVPPERGPIKAANDTTTSVLFDPTEDGISPSTDTDQGTAAEFTGETDGIMLPERDLIEVAENAIADVVFSPQSLAEGGVRAINVVDASGAVNANLFEDVLVRPERELIAAAETAMEDYLSQDDGGGDWLMAMKDIMDE